MNAERLTVFGSRAVGRVLALCIAILSQGAGLPACSRSVEVLTRERSPGASTPIRRAPQKGASEDALDAGRRSAPGADASGAWADPATAGSNPRVTAGVAHACAVLQERLYCWGNNAYGQLGLGHAELVQVATEVRADVPWRAVAAGDDHTCALSVEGKVYCAGRGEHGQLGRGTRQDDGSMEPVSLPAPMVFITAGSSHSCAIDEGGSVWCWGANFEGQLGLGDRYSSDQKARDALSPRAVDVEPMRWLSGGNGHTCGVATAGALYCFGRNTDHETSTSDEQQRRAPTRNGELQRWERVAAGQNHSCGLTVDGSFWCWGLNVGSPEGPFGTAVAGAIEPIATIEGSWRELSSNTFHSCAINTEQVLWCWGRNIEGQLGLNDVNARTEPARVAASVVAVAAGRFFTCVIFEGNDVACSGANESGQLASGNTERQDSFEPIQFEHSD